MLFHPDPANPCQRATLSVLLVGCLVRGYLRLVGPRTCLALWSTAGPTIDGSDPSRKRSSSGWRLFYHGTRPALPWFHRVVAALGRTLAALGLQLTSSSSLVAVAGIVRWHDLLLSPSSLVARDGHDGTQTSPTDAPSTRAMRPHPTIRAFVTFGCWRWSHRRRAESGSHDAGSWAVGGTLTMVPDLPAGREVGGRGRRDGGGRAAARSRGAPPSSPVTCRCRTR